MESRKYGHSFRSRKNLLVTIGLVKGKIHGAFLQCAWRRTFLTGIDKIDCSKLFREGKILEAVFLDYFTGKYNKCR